MAVLYACPKCAAEFKKWGVCKLHLTSGACPAGGVDREVDEELMEACRAAARQLAPTRPSAPGDPPTPPDPHSAETNAQQSRRDRIVSDRIKSVKALKKTLAGVPVPEGAPPTAPAARVQPMHGSYGKGKSAGSNSGGAMLEALLPPDERRRIDTASLRPLKGLHPLERDPLEERMNQRMQHQQLRLMAPNNFEYVVKVGGGNYSSADGSARPGEYLQEGALRGHDARLAECDNASTTSTSMDEVGLRVDRSWAGLRGARNSSRDELRHERVDEGPSDRSDGGSNDRSDEPKAEVPP